MLTREGPARFGRGSGPGSGPELGYGRLRLRLRLGLGLGLGSGFGFGFGWLSWLAGLRATYDPEPTALRTCWRRRAALLAPSASVEKGGG